MKKEKQINSVLILLLALLLLAALLIWPIGLIPIHQEYHALEYGMAQSGTITESTPLAGIIQPVSGHIDGIRIRFLVPDRLDNPGILHFLLKDAQGNPLHTADVPLTEIKNNKYYEFPLSQTLTAGQSYLFEITASGAGDKAPSFWLGSPQTACPGAVSVYYCGQELTNNALMMQLTGTGRASFRQSLPYEISLLAVMILLFVAWKGGK